MKNRWRPVPAVCWNILLAMLLFTLARIIFIAFNWHCFPLLTVKRAVGMCIAGLKYDLSAILCAMLPYLAAEFIPCGKRWFRTVKKLLYVLPLAVMSATDAMDTSYFPFTSERTAFSIFSEFQGDSNVAAVILAEFRIHWYLVLEGAAMIAALFFMYRESEQLRQGRRLTRALTAVAAAALAAAGIRWTFNPFAPALNTSSCNSEIESPCEAAIVLNSGFNVLHSISRKTYASTGNDSRGADMFTPVHYPDSGAVFRPKNVCILVLESFSSSYSSLLTEEHGHPYEGYMPFLDSLMQESLCGRWSFANGRKSIEALSSISGIPSVGEPFVLTAYRNNGISGIAAELTANKGYSAAFFHGAEAGSMGFEDFTRRTGYAGQYSMNTYGNMGDYDGTWAIWDGPFLQYFKETMSSMKEPFVTTVFTASSHHPFHIPEQYKDAFHGGTLPMYRCIQYVDECLRQFFMEASREPWYDNTLFVITGDHTGITDRDEYHTDYGLFEIPILFYSPSGDIKGMRDCIVQQTDIMPTVLAYLGYDRPFVSFGQNLLDTPDEDTYAFNCLVDWYQLFKGEWCLQYDGKEFRGLYSFKEDMRQENNLLDSRRDVVGEMAPLMMSIIGQYTDRMVEDRLTFRDGSEN